MLVGGISRCGAGHGIIWKKDYSVNSSNIINALPPDWQTGEINHLFWSSESIWRKHINHGVIIAITSDSEYHIAAALT